LSSKADRFQRRLKVKDLALKGYSTSEIAKKLGVKPKTIQKDLEWVKEYWTKLTIYNKHIAEKQYEYVQKFLEELNIVKRELYDLLEEAKKKGKFRTRLDTLKTIIQRIDQEAKILGLINPAKLVVNNFIHVDTLKNIMTIVASIIQEFVPPDKRQYAFERLQKIKIESLQDKIIDAKIEEVKEE